MGTELERDGTRLTPRFAEAMAWAAELHRDQARKGKPLVPYISHPIGVASLVLADGGTEDEAIAALLHDAVEDCDVPLTEIRFRFGNQVGNIVDSATDTLPDSTDRGKDDWKARKTEYLTHLKDVDVPALRVSAADKLYNARDIVADLRVEGIETMRRFSASPSEIAWYYVSLVQIFERRLPGMLAEELSATVDQFLELATTDARHGPLSPGSSAFRNVGPVKMA